VINLRSASRRTGDNCPPFSRPPRLDG
jgi:hypothetical protein